MLPFWPVLLPPRFLATNSIAVSVFALFAIRFQYFVFFLESLRENLLASQINSTVRFFVPQNAQNEVRYAPVAIPKKDLTNKLVISFHTRFPIYPLTSLNVSGHVI
jgi:hypothetical protein